MAYGIKISYSIDFDYLIISGSMTQTIESYPILQVPMETMPPKYSLEQERGIYQKKYGYFAREDQKIHDHEGDQPFSSRTFARSLLQTKVLSLSSSVANSLLS
jgi:hypothetical protein